MLSPVLFIPHGGGPLPLLQDPAHRRLTTFLSGVGKTLGQPRAMVVISAHWEQVRCTVQTNPAPALLYDYQGFPAAAYQLQYPAPGAPELAQEILWLLRSRGIAAVGDVHRDFDHGVFVPLTLMYPAADIPCIQLSLLNDMDPGTHIAIGAAISSLREQGVLILGSGSSFHNMAALRDGPVSKERCAQFDAWLDDLCCRQTMQVARQGLLQWQQAPHARYAHPREEHLLPLHVCFGAAAGAGRPAQRVFNDVMMGYQMSSFLWH